MNESSFSMDEFMRHDPPENAASEPTETAEEEVVETVEVEELDVQKAVVESLAEDKAKLVEDNESLKRKLLELETNLSTTKSALETALSDREKAITETARVKDVMERQEARIRELESKFAELEMRQFDAQERNPNALALIDRDVELPDRFPGETRDHVLEVVKEAREKAEAEGRVRKAQILESVLVANEPSGELAKRRANLEKFFNDNGNILSGPVIEELQKSGISHKNGEEYLLPSEILLRTY